MQTDDRDAAAMAARLAGPGPPRLDAVWDPARLVAAASMAAQAPESVAGLAARVQLLAARQDFAAADTVLAGLVAGIRFAATPGLTAQACLAALAAQRLDVLGDILSHWHGVPGMFACGFDAVSPLRTIARLTVSADRRWFIGINPDIPACEGAARYLAYLGGVLPLLATCAPCAGTTRVGLADGMGEAGLGFSSHRPDVSLIPDPSFIRSRAYADIRATYDAGWVAWADRAPRAFWRGATTGFRGGPDRHWRHLPRIVLCALGQAFPAHIDAAIVSFGHLRRPEDKAEIEAAGLVRPSVPPVDFLRWKYQIDIDGNTNAWAGLFIKLLSGSPVLKVASARHFRQWYYHRLVPWENFVPVASDMSDLVAVIDRLRADDALAARIGAAGRALALSMTLERESAAGCDTIVAALVRR